MPVGSPPTGVHLERPAASGPRYESVMFCHEVLAARLAEWFRLHPRPPAAQPARSHSLYTLQLEFASSYGCVRNACSLLLRWRRSTCSRRLCMGQHRRTEHLPSRRSRVQTRRRVPHRGRLLSEDHFLLSVTGRRDCTRGAGAAMRSGVLGSLALAFRSADGHLIELQPLSPSFPRRILTSAWASQRVSGGTGLTPGPFSMHSRCLGDPGPPANRDDDPDPNPDGEREREREIRSHFGSSRERFKGKVASLPPLFSRLHLLGATPSQPGLIPSVSLSHPYSDAIPRHRPGCPCAARAHRPRTRPGGVRFTRASTGGSRTLPGSSPATPSATAPRLHHAGRDRRRISRDLQFQRHSNGGTPQ